MEWFGVIAFILVLCMPSHDKEIKNHETRLKRIENKSKGDSAMSKLIKETVGHECIIKSPESFALTGNVEMTCHVLDVDDEWVKVRYVHKKETKTKLLRISAIDEVELTELTEKIEEK